MKASMHKWAWAAIAGATALGAPALASEITWKASIWGSPRTVTQPFEWFAKEVAAKTDGQMKIDFTYEKIQAQQAAEVLKSGAADATYVCATYFADKMTLPTVMHLPMFAPEKIPVLGRVQTALADHPAIQAELKPWNMKILIPAPQQQYQIMGTRRVARIDDFRGLKMRVPAEMGKLLEEYGAVIRLLSGPESRGAIQNGTIEVVASPYPVSQAAFKIHEVSKYVTDNISLGSQFCYFAVNLKSWEALPAKLRSVMQGSRASAVAQYESNYAREDGPLIASFKQQGMQFVSFNSTDRARLLARAIKYWKMWVEEREKQGLNGREVFEFAQAKIREHSRD